MTTTPSEAFDNAVNDAFGYDRISRWLYDGLGELIADPRFKAYCIEQWFDERFIPDPDSVTGNNGAWIYTLKEQPQKGEHD